MNRVAKSLFFFGIYILLLGATLVVAPNILLKFFGVPKTTEVWIRIVGMLILILSYYYIRASRNSEGWMNFIKGTIFTRPFVFVFLAAFVLLRYVQPILILFGVFDLAGAVWSVLALRSLSN